MRYVFILTLLTAPLAGLPARAQYGYAPPAGIQGNGVALVTNWIQQYLHRPPNSLDLANGQSIDAGAADPLAILVGSLAAGSTTARSPRVMTAALSTMSSPTSPAAHRRQERRGTGTTG
jgi:hypothetical protein